MFRIVLDDLPGEDGFHDFIELDALRHHPLLRMLRDANLLPSCLLAATCLKGSDVIGAETGPLPHSPGLADPSLSHLQV